MTKGKVCFVTQRYGLEVNGGAELQCRLFAEHLCEAGWSVTVATTKAIDYISWKNEYTKDEEEINGVTVRRFPVVKERNLETFHLLNAKFLEGQLQESEEKKWFEEQGPFSPKLIQYIKDEKNNYDAFVFFTYLYYPTVMGLEEVKDKAILVPEAHDEPFMKFHCVKKLFESPKAFFLNTEEERDLIWERFETKDIPYEIGGIGIDVPKDIDGERFKKKYDLDQYVVYVGRIDEGKNCNELFDYFLEYKYRNPSCLKLVLMGKNVIPVPDVDDIVNLGFVSEEDKYDGMAGANALILPSKFESLSMVVLESMAVETPVIVNGECEVLKGHCIKSNGAFYYNDYFQFEGELNFLLKKKDDVAEMIQNAMEYVDRNYRWEILVDKLERLIVKVRS
ncbi:MAG: glycosyltransferase [Lachnospiraceae bacterium]|nr:glycosyltransferase [Lachnospiraceae bacterium]